MRRLLLLSNSRDDQGRYLEHPRDALRELLGDVRRVTFVPFAAVGRSWDDYAEHVAPAFAAIGCEVDPVHRHADMAAAVRGAEAIAVGGGNTFHLLLHLYETGLVEPLRERAGEG